MCSWISSDMKHYAYHKKKKMYFMKTRSLLNQDCFTEVISVCFIEGNFVSMYQSSWISSDPFPHFIACSCKLNCTCNQRDIGKYTHRQYWLLWALQNNLEITFFLALISAGTTTLSKSIPTLACATRITSPTSSSLDVWQGWLCFMESYWMVSCLTPGSRL